MIPCQDVYNETRARCSLHGSISRLQPDWYSPNNPPPCFCDVRTQSELSRIAICRLCSLYVTDRLGIKEGIMGKKALQKYLVSLPPPQW